MAGLLSAGEGGGEQASNVTPEEQAQYDEFVNNAYRIVYSEKTFSQFMARLRTAAEQDPVQGLAATTVMVVLRVQESAKRNGKLIDPVVVFHAGVEIIESLADTATKAGIHEYDEKEVEAASLQAMDLYRAQASELGLVDEDAAKQDFAAMQQADKEGRLNEMFPGVVDRYAPIGKKVLAQEEGVAEGEGMRQMPQGRR